LNENPESQDPENQEPENQEPENQEPENGAGETRSPAPETRLLTGQELAILAVR
jgi:hypothetical protein